MTQKERQQVYDMAKELAYNKHKKDRQDVLERAVRRTVRAYKQKRNEESYDTSKEAWRLAGEADAFETILDERAKRQARPSKAQSRQARLKKLRDQYDEIRKRMGSLGAAINTLMADEEEGDSEEEESSPEEGAIVVDTGSEEEEEEEELPLDPLPGPSARRDDDDDDYNGGVVPSGSARKSTGRGRRIEVFM